MTYKEANDIIVDGMQYLMQEVIKNSYENRQNRSVVDIPALNIIVLSAQTRMITEIGFKMSEDPDGLKKLWEKHQEENDWRIPDEQAAQISHGQSTCKGY